MRSSKVLGAVLRVTAHAIYSYRCGSSAKRQQSHKKSTKFETKTEDMGTAELSSNLHKIVDRIEDERLLKAIYSF